MYKHECVPDIKVCSYIAVRRMSAYSGLRETLYNQEILWTFPFQSQTPSSTIQFINNSSKRIGFSVYGKPEQKSACKQQSVIFCIYT